MTHPKIILDLEVYRNFFLCGTLSLDTGKINFFTEKHLPQLARWCEVHQPCFITFNGQHYDLRLLRFAFQWADHPNVVALLKRFSDFIIDGPPEPGLKSAYREYWWNDPHVDLKQVLGGRNCPSLKKLAYRLRLPKLETLPIDPHLELTDDQKEQIRKYNKVDLTNTRHLYEYCEPLLELRRVLTKECGVDCTSLADAQIAERVLAQRVRGYPPGFETHDRPLSVALGAQSLAETHFTHPALGAFWVQLTAHQLAFDKVYNPIKRKQSIKPAFVLGEEKRHHFRVDTPLPVEFRFGGLHSVHTRAVRGEEAYECDVVSYYPNLILKHRVVPVAADEGFLEEYRRMYERRLDARRRGDKVTADSLKIVLNATFGKYNEFFSKLRDPLCSVGVCLHGELHLLRLMDLCWEHGVDVLMANTDGVVTRQDPKVPMYRWRKETGLPLEFRRIERYVIRDSNNHVFRYEDGSRKVKGAAFAHEPSISKQSNFPVINRAIVAYLLDDVPVERTILECEDVHEFLACYAKGATIETIKLSATPEDEGAPLPPVVRWYLARGCADNVYRKNAKGWSRVPDSEGCKVFNTVTGLPEDVDREKYVLKAESKLAKLLR